MHDGLAQVLGYVNTKSQAIEELLAAGRTDEARGLLARAGGGGPVDLRRRPRGDPRAAQPGRARRRPRRRGRGLRRPLRRGLEDRRPRRRAGRGPPARPRAGRRGAGLPDRPGGADQRPQALRRAPRRGRLLGRRTAGSTSSSPTTATGSSRRRGRADRPALRAPGDARAGRQHRRDASTGRTRRTAAAGSTSRSPRPTAAPPVARRGGDLMRIVLADDHALFRDGVSSLLEAWGHEVVGHAADGREAVDLVVRLEPDLVLMDVRMPGMSGVEATGRSPPSGPETPIVMLTVSEDEDDLFAAIQAGARGYLLKDLEAAQLRTMIEAVARGEAAITPATAARIIRHLTSLGALAGRGGPGPADRARARRPPAGHRRPAQQGDRGRARDLGEHGQVPPPEHPREAPRPEPDRGRDARAARGTRRRGTDRRPGPVRPGRPHPFECPGPPRRAWCPPAAAADARPVTRRRRPHGLPHRHRPHGLHQLRHLHGHLSGRGARHVAADRAGHRDGRLRHAAGLDDGAPGPGRRMHRLRHLHRRVPGRRHDPGRRAGRDGARAPPGPDRPPGRPARRARSRGCRWRA